MILGQLIQTGRRFCECRSADFIPGCDTLHTLMAYGSDDRFSARQFGTAIFHDPEPARAWLDERSAIAYILISRDFDRSQAELPPPIGLQREPALMITAATEDSLARSLYTVTRLTDPVAARLNPIPLTRDIQPLARINLFAPPAPAPIPWETSLFAELIGSP